VGDFSGKNVLILGGSRGIGAAIVRRFAKGDGKVAFTYAGSKEAAEALAAETEAEAIRADSTDRDALIATVASRGPSISWLALRVCSSWAIRLRSTPTPSTG
jgi:cyclic-di-GMP-binding biofilm dispersal mediator protein